jgi:uncharacterized membrane protein YraQ (UPF0718 family)
MSFFLSEAGAILDFVARAFLHIVPFLAISIPIAVALRRTGAAEKIRASLSGNPLLAVVLATIVGAVSPFCSCGVVPVISALLISGVPLAPVMSFWLASPSMDPEIFVLSVGSIGLELAVWRVAATFAMSLGGGLAVLVLERRGWIGREGLRPIAERREAPVSKPRFTRVPAGASPCCAAAPAAALRSEGRSCGCGGARSAPPRFEVVELAREAGRTAAKLSLAMLLAFFLEAVIVRYLPQRAVAGLLGGDKPWSVALATLLGIPMYTTNLSALGIVAGLLSKGASGGAALAFLVGGAVTTLPAMAAVYKLVRPRAFLLYLGFSVAGSLLAGYAYEAVRMLMGR